MHWQFLTSAFALGLVSSLHCVGMCGALALSIPTQGLPPVKKVLNILLYNGGRVITYSLLGFAFGLFGRGIYLGGLQQLFSIVAGITILLVIFSVYLRISVPRLRFFKLAGYWIQMQVLHVTRKPGKTNVFILGLANGLLPCGLVYLAVTAALAEGTVTGAVAFMIVFGSATIPAMFLLSYFGFLVKVSLRNKFKKVVPFMMGFMAVLLIIRGLGLGAPYLSPKLAPPGQGIISCH